MERSLFEKLTPTGSAEEQLYLASSLRTLMLLQEYPDLGLIATTGIVVPPHERTMLYAQDWGAASTVFVASRGTSKSSTLCVLNANYHAATHARRKVIIVSATGFRGGQMMFTDAAQWLNGGWDSQEPDVKLLRACIQRPQLLNRSQNYWEIEYDSFSKLVTLPTKDPDAIRGHRAQELRVDEANFFDREIIDKVFQPFLNVKGDFRHGGAYATGNKICFVSTIDYNWRPFQDRIKAARDGISRDMAAKAAAEKGDWERFNDFDREGLSQHHFVKFDYTDLLIRRRVKNREGIEYELDWPNPDHPLTHDIRGVPFTERDAQGQMMLRGPAVDYYPTYPIDKEGLERPLLDGSTDQASWLSEQRNILDTAMGDVYSHDLVDRASCRGVERSIIPFDQLGKDWQKQYAEEPRDYTPPVLWRCGDPCVLGVDYAPLSDFCAFVVMRVGPCAEGDFDPFTHHGKTDWSNVIWAEQHRQMSHKEAANKIRALGERYNLVWFDDPTVVDPWEACRAIGLDMRGGGNGIRDELAFISDEEVPEGMFRIYDRFDKDERVANFITDRKARPMLDAHWPSDQSNDKLVEFTVGQMQMRLLYIGKYLPLSDRPRSQPELYIAYDAMLSLDAQLRKLRQAPTKNFRTFYMEGDTDKDKNKKDLWSGFIYAAKQARAHIIRQRQIDNTPPPLGALMTRIGSGRGMYGRRIPGSSL